MDQHELSARTTEHAFHRRQLRGRVAHDGAERHVDVGVEVDLAVADEADGVTGEFDVVEIGAWSLDPKIDDARTKRIQVGRLDPQHLEHRHHHWQLVDVCIAQPHLPPARERVGTGAGAAHLHRAEDASAVGMRGGERVAREPFQVGIPERCRQGKPSRIAGRDTPVEEQRAPRHACRHPARRGLLSDPGRRRTKPHTAGIHGKRPLHRRQLHAPPHGAVDRHVAESLPCLSVGLAAQTNAAVHVFDRRADIERTLFHVELHVPRCGGRPGGGMNVERSGHGKEPAEMDRGDRLLQPRRQGMQHVVVGTEAVGGELLEGDVPATARHKSADAPGGDGCPVVRAPNPLEGEQSVLPVQLSAETLQTVGKPGRFDRHGVALWRGLDLDLGPPCLHVIPHGRGKLRVPPRVDIVPDLPHAGGERITKFFLEHDAGAGQLEREFAVVVTTGHQHAVAPHDPGVVRSGDVADRPVSAIHAQAARHIRQRIGKARIGHGALHETDPQRIGVAARQRRRPFVPEDEVEGAGGPERTNDVGAAGRHGCEQRVVDPHGLAAHLQRAIGAARFVGGRRRRDRAKASLHLHRVATGLSGEVDRQRLALQHDRADGAVETVGKPVVRQRHVAAPQGDIGLDRAIATGDLRPHVDLARREELAPMRRHRVWQQPFPMPSHHQPLGLQEQVEVRGVRPAGIAAAATQERRAGVRLELVEPQPRAISLERGCHVTHREWQRGMLEAA